MKKPLRKPSLFATKKSLNLVKGVNEKMKRMLCLVIVCVLCLTYTAYGAAENQVEIMYNVSENFNSAENGTFPEKIDVVAKTNRIEISDFKSTSDKCVKFTALEKSDSYIDVLPGQIDGIVYFEFDVCFENKPDGYLDVFFKNSSGAERQLARFDKSLNLCLPDGKQIFTCNENKFYKITFELLLEKSTANIYVNNLKRAENVVFSQNAMENAASFRIHSRGIGDGIKPVFYVDNISVYSSQKPDFVYESMGYTVIKKILDSDISASVATMEETVQYMKNTVALYVGSNKLFADGEISYIDENANIAAIVKNLRTFVPLRAVSIALDSEVTWDESLGKASIKHGDSEIIVTRDSNVISVNGNAVELDVAAFIYQDRIFVPLRAVSEAFGKKITYHKSGLIVISDKENFFNFKDDLHIFRKLCGELCFANPCGEEIVQTISNTSHPRLLTDENGINIIRERINTDENMSSWFSNVIRQADRYLEEETVKYNLHDGLRLYTTSREIMQQLAFAYRITSDSKYLERCIAEMNNVIAYPDWNPNHFLDTAFLSEGLAFAYDWLYDDLSPKMRADCETALLTKGIAQGLEDYNDLPRKRTFRWAQSPTGDNWNLICNSCMIRAAIVVADKEPSTAAEVFDAGFESLKNAVVLYGPDGAWYEGPSYWAYGTEPFIDLMSSLENVCNDTFGYLSVPGIAETGYYMDALTGPCGTFNFHDADESIIDSPIMFFLGDYINDSNLTTMHLRQMKNSKASGAIRDLLWYNPETASDVISLPDGGYYRDAEIATMRNGREESSLYVGIHAGKVNVYHGHYDIGSFVIDAFGTRFAADIGADNYNINDSRSNLYRYRAEGHNTLVINPGKDAGQDITSSAVIDKFENGRKSAYALIDMTDAYKKDALSVKRGMKLLKDKNEIILQDEIKSDKPMDVWWFMQTKQQIIVSDDKKSAIIKGKYRDMRVSLMEDIDGEFSTMNAEPLPTSPTNSQQNRNLSYTKLCFHVKDVTDITIPILFDFVLSVDGIDIPLSNTKFEPLDNWVADDSEYEGMPTLDELNVNGNLIEGFDKEKNIYNVRLESGADIPEITASGSGTVDVSYDGKVPGYAVVKITSQNNSDICNYYVIKISREILLSAPEGAKKILPVGIEAETQQEENPPKSIMDNDLSTRWSALGKNDVVFDLGGLYRVQYIGFAIYNGDTRRQYFDVLVSNDGENYTQIFSDETSGTRTDEEIFQIPSSDCRYVKIQCKGSSVSDWNSITECGIYEFGKARGQCK